MEINDYHSLLDAYQAKFNDVFPIMQFRGLSLEEAAAMIKEAIETGKPVEIPEEDAPDALY